MEQKEGEGFGKVPEDDPESKERGEKARKELDEIPAPGTDPLHEGP